MNTPHSNQNFASSTTGSVTRWIDLFRLGDQEAASFLWNRYFAPLVGIARSKLGRLPSGALDAEDVALSAFHAFYRAAATDRFPEMQNRDSLWLSLLLVTSGKVLDAKRRELCQKRGGNTNSRPLHDLMELVECEQPDPTTAAILAEEVDCLFECLGDRELQEIALLKLEGCTNEEVSARLHCSERTVKRRLAIIRRIWEESSLAPDNG